MLVYTATTNGTIPFKTFVGDIVVIQDDKLVPTKWPITWVINTHPGKDSLVRITTVKTAVETYKMPTTKLALLISFED